MLLVPVALYLGARWYVGYRIDNAIASANADGNTLAVADYSYGFFPIHLTATQISFGQDRETFAARGRLHHLEVSGLNLWSLVSADPIQLDHLALRGLDASLIRHAATPGDTSQSSPLHLIVEAVTLDSTFVTVEDEVNQQELHLANFNLELRSLHLPFRPAALTQLRVVADSASYRDARSDTRLSASAIGYATSTASIQIASVEVSRDTSVDLRASQLTFSGLRGEDLQNEMYVDSISIASLGGKARVPGNSGKAKDTTSTTPIGVGTLSLPDIDLTVSGKFGKVDFRGQVTSGSLRYRDTLSLRSLTVRGEHVRFAGAGGLSVAVQHALVDQGELHYPLIAGETGPTVVRIGDLQLQTEDQQVSARGGRYDSDNQDLTAGEVKFSGPKLSGSLASVAVSGVDRAGLLAGDPATAREAVLSNARLVLAQPDGGSYRIEVPESRATGIQFGRDLRIERVQIENAGVRRRRSDGKEDLVATGIYVDQFAVTSPVTVENLGPTRLRAADIRMTSGEVPVDYRFHQVAYDTRAGILTLDSLNRTNQLSPDEMFTREVGKSWLDFSFDGLRASGIDHDELVAGKTIDIDSLSANDFRLMVVEDLSLDLPSGEKMMPIEALRQVGPRIILRAARLSSTEIAYGVVDSILEPKTIHFNDGTVELSGLDTEWSTTDSVFISYDATFEGTTPLHAEFVLARDSSGRNYAVRGELGSYDLSRVNPLMEVAAEAIVETGVIDRMRYRGALKDEVMTGHMELLYHDLDLQAVGRGAWIKNLISGLVVKEENLPGEDFRLGKMYHEHDLKKSFFNAYWKGLVSGMRSSALADVALEKELN